MKKPVLVVIDIQKEYITKGRSFCLENIGPSLINARNILDHARKNQWTVIHVQHFQEGEIFNKNSEFSALVSGFEPIKGEHLVIKNDFSSYSSPEFVPLMKEYKEHPIFVIGYGSTMCCLSTIIDGYHRGNQFTFIKDASLAKKGSRFDELSTHEYATDIISTYAQVKTAQEVIANIYA